MRRHIVWDQKLYDKIFKLLDEGIESSLIADRIGVRPATLSEHVTNYRKKAKEIGMPRILTTHEERFLQESNRIEGITSDVNSRQIKAFIQFLDLDKIEIKDMIKLVAAFQPDAVLRDRKGLDVRVGNHIPLKGGSSVPLMLDQLLDRINSDTIDAYHAHVFYETLHPFTDGNGRSGRMLWWKMMGGSGIGFLHKWYYQSLAAGERK